MEPSAPLRKSVMAKRTRTVAVLDEAMWSDIPLPAVKSARPLVFKICEKHAAEQDKKEKVERIIAQSHESSLLCHESL